MDTESVEINLKTLIRDNLVLIINFCKAMVKNLLVNRVFYIFD